MQEVTYWTTALDVGRVDRAISQWLALPRSQARGLVDHGAVKINGVACTDSGTPVSEGDEIHVRYEPNRRYPEKSKERATHGFKVTFCDEHLVVVEKEAGLLTVPTEARERRTLTSLLATHLGRGDARRGVVSVVHRLDRETSGLLVFGRNAGIAKALIAQFAARKPEREYAAIVAGLVASDDGTIQSHLYTDKSLNQKSGPQGDLAVTHYQVLERYRDSTLVAVKLETGRRNQIRVHFAEADHPVLGDTRYRPTMAAHAAWPYKRLALHARLLGFEHPVSKKKLRFEAELPREFAMFARASRSR